MILFYELAHHYYCCYFNRHVDFVCDEMSMDLYGSQKYMNDSIISSKSSEFQEYRFIFEHWSYSIQCGDSVSRLVPLFLRNSSLRYVETPSK